MDYNFKNGYELENNYADLAISQIMLRREAVLQGVEENVVWQIMREQLLVMKESLALGLKGEMTSLGGLVQNDGARLMAYAQADKSLAKGLLAKAAAAAMAVNEVNACMGRIVAAPTGGAGGILPGVLFTLAPEHGWNEECLVSALFAGAAIGCLIAKDATLAGAEGGCQAETGSAAAMAAAALVEIQGGSRRQALQGAAIALTHVMGLVCDPVAGLVEMPCIWRNAIGAANAILSADMALAGCQSRIPFDEVVAAMGEVGRSMPPSLRETGQGGIAGTPTGVEIAKALGLF